MTASRAGSNIQSSSSSKNVSLWVCFLLGQGGTCSRERGRCGIVSLGEGSGESERLRFCLGVCEMDMSELIEKIQVHRFLCSNKKLYRVFTGTNHTSAGNKNNFS